MSKITILLLMIVPLSAFCKDVHFVDVSKVAPGIIIDMRYLTTNNFVDSVIDGYYKNICYLTEDSAIALKNVSQYLKKKGYALRVFDCYRPQRAVNHFVRWAIDTDDLKTKTKYYPKVKKNRLFKDGYIAKKSGHSRGSTVDLSIIKLGAKITAPNYHDCRKVDKTELGAELDMGTYYDCFSLLSHTANTDISKVATANRILLKKAMVKFGFKNYSKEWWHYTLKNEKFPNTYFDFLVK